MEKFKTYIYTGLAIIIVVGIIYYIGRRSGKLNPATLPQDKPNSPLTEAEKTYTTTLAQKLYADMKGVNIWFNRNLAPHQEFLQLSDKLFVAVYNKFNQLYHTSSNETLTQWYQNEDSYIVAGTMTFVTLKKAILDRLSRLSLT